MHEVGIANAIIEAGQAEAARLSGSKLIRIGIRLGTLAGLDSDALRFAFAALTQGTNLEAVVFEIQSCPRRDRCLDCAWEFTSGVCSGSCPSCASQKVVLVGGDELDLVYVEVEEA